MNENNSIAIDIEADVSDVEPGVKQLEGQMNRAGKSVQDLNAAFRQTAAITLQATQGLTANAEEATKLLDRYDPLGAKVRQLTADIKALEAAADAGHFGPADDARVDAVYGRMQTQLKDTRAALLSAGTAGTAAFDAIENGAERGAFATAGARRELIVLGHEAVTGNFSRMPGSFMVLAERANFSTAALLGVGAAVAGVAAVGYVLAKAYNEGHAEMEAMNNALEVTSNFAGMTRGQMIELAQSVSDSGTVTIATAKGIVTALVSSGQVGAQAIGTVARIAEDFAVSTGKDLKQIAPELVKVFADPTRGAEQLNAQMHFLSVADLERIAHLQRIGELGEAQLLLAQKTEEHLPKTTANLGYLQTAWNYVGKAASAAWNDMLGLGRDKTLEEKIADVQRVLNDPIRASQLGREELQKQLLILQSQLKVAQDKAKVDGDSAENNRKQSDAQKEVDKALTHQVQMKRDELTLLQNAPDSIDKQRRIFEINKEIENLQRSISSEGRQAQQAEIDGSLKLQEITISMAEQQNDASLKLGQISQQDHDKRKTALELEKNTIEQTATIQQRSVAGLTVQEKQKLDIALARLKAEREVIQQRGDTTLLEDQQKQQEAMDRWLASLTDEADKMQREVDLYGLTRAQIEKNIIAQLELTKARAAESGATEQQLKDLDAEIEARKRIVDAAITRQQLDQQADMWRSIESVAHQTWDSIEHGGKSAFERLRDSLKNSLWDLLYQLTLKKWIINITADVTSQGVAQQAFGAAASGGGIGGSGGLMNMLSSWSSWSDMPSVGTALGNLGSSWSTFTTMMGNGSGFLESAKAALAGTGSSFATLSPYLAAGAQLLQGDVKGAATTAALAYVGNMILPGIGGLIGGAVGGLFGGGSKEQPHNNADSRTLAVKLSAAGAGTPYSNGWGPSWVVSGSNGGHGRWADHPAVDQATMGSLDQATKAIFDSGRQLAQVLGVDAHALDSVAVASENFKDANDALGQLSDAVATKLLPQSVIAQFAQSGETTSQTLQRVASDIQGLDAITKRLGVSINLTGDASQRAATVEKIVGAAGGSQAFASLVQGYYQNFYSDEERVAALTQDLAVRFRALGLQMPTTKQGFRDLETSLLNGDQASQVLAGEVLTMSDAFNQAAESAKSAAAASKKLADAQAALSVGDLSPFAPLQKYGIESQMLDQAFATAQGGDQTSIDAFIKVAQDFLTSSHQVNASGDAYTADYQRVQQMYDTLKQATQQSGAIKVPVVTTEAPAAATAATTVSAAVTPAAPWPDGTFVRDPSTMQVFNVEQGLLRWIPDPTVAESVFGAAWHNAPNYAGAAQLWTQEGSLNIPGHATGLDRVPYDGYLMFAHKDEAVLNARDAADWRSGSAGITGPDLTALRDEIRGVRSEISRLAAIVHDGDQRNVDATQGLATTHREIAYRQEVQGALR